MLGNLVDKLFGPWCQALDETEEATCWEKVPLGQPSLICDDCWELLSRHGRLNQKAEMSNMKNLPPPAVDNLVRDSNALVRKGLADNPRVLLAEHVSALCKPNEEPLVLRAMARRNDLTEKDEQNIIEANDIASLRLLAANHSTSPRSRAQLAGHKDPTVVDATRM